MYVEKNRMKEVKSILSKLARIYLVLSIILLSYSCSRNNNECPSESLGHLQLLPSTIEGIPYGEGDVVYFKDKLQNEIYFIARIERNTQVFVGNYTIISSSGESTSVSSHEFSIPCENDPNQNLVFNYQYSPVYNFLRDTLNTTGVCLGISTRIVAFKENGKLQQADALLINSEQQSNYHNYIIADQRTLANKYLMNFSQAIDEITFLDKTFYNVYINEDENKYYNKQLGFVAFADSTDKIWVFDRIEY